MHFQSTLQRLNAFAVTFWDYVGNHKIFAFHGEMGAGKTTLISALCSVKGVVEVKGSPTFSIINEYGYKEAGQNRILYHIDLYRLKDEAEIIAAGVEECIYSGNICFVEWADKAPAIFPEETVHVWLSGINETERSVKIELPKGSIAEQS